MRLPTLYARSSKGKVKVWSIWTEGSNLHVEHGFVDGKKQTSFKPISGKNIGRANETTPEQQAEKEALSKWKKQKDKGYVEDVDNIPQEAEVDLFLPMLAHPVEKKQHLITYPCNVQPKLDGIRCLARKRDGVVTLWSRTGKVIPRTILTELHEDLERMLEDGQCTDGELFHPDWTFQAITKAVKKRRDDVTAEVQYWIYDMPSAKEWTPRLADLLRLHGKLYMSGTRLRAVRTLQVQGWEGIETMEKVFLEEGYEGLMVRSLKGTYKFGHRSSDLLKMKRFKEEEYEIVGGRSGTGKDAGTVVFTCKDSAGQEFDVRPVGSHAHRATLLENLQENIGKLLTVKFFEFTEAGIPRFPVGKGIRDYE